MLCNVKVCRVCFATQRYLYFMTTRKNLDQGYETLTGLSINNEDNLPPYLCAECAQRLLNCVNFRTKCLQAHSILLEVIKNHDCITLEAINSTIGNQNPLVSNLAVTPTDYYELGIEEDNTHVGRDTVSRELMNIQEYNINGRKMAENTPGQMLEVTIVKVERGEEEEVKSSMSKRYEPLDKDPNNDDITLPNLEEHVKEIKVEDSDKVDELFEVAIVNVKEETEDDIKFPMLENYDPFDGPSTKNVESGEGCSSSDSRHEPKRPDSQWLSHLQVMNVSNESILREHLTAYSGDKPYNPYTCEVCSKRFRTKHAVQVHMHIHSDKKPIACEVCKKVFKKRGSLKIHLRLHSGEKPYPCSMCNKAFIQKSTLDAHTKAHSGVKPYSCDICTKTFGSKGNLRKHLRVHNDDKPYSCKICYKTYAYSSDLSIHLQTHSGEKPYTCKICMKSYTRASVLGVHMKIHSGEKLFSCDICNKALGNKTSLINHLRTHSNEKPYSCDICHKAFKEKSNLRQHYITHSTERPYSCTVCQKTFISKANVRKHMIIHTGEKPFTCRVCNRAFNKNNNLEKHMRLHSGEKPYSCDICLKSFSDNSNLRYHKMKHIKYT